METKLARLKQMMVSGDYRGALHLASTWSRLGEHRDAITKGWAAMANPRFYADIGQNPDQLVQAGLTAIRERYGL